MILRSVLSLFHGLSTLDYLVWWIITQPRPRVLSLPHPPEKIKMCFSYQLHASKSSHPQGSHYFQFVKSQLLELFGDFPILVIA